MTKKNLLNYSPGTNYNEAKIEKVAAVEEEVLIIISVKKLFKDILKKIMKIKKIISSFIKVIIFLSVLF